MPLLPRRPAVCIEGLRTHDIALIGSSFSPATILVTPAKTLRSGEILDFPGALYREFPDWRMQV